MLSLQAEIVACLFAVSLLGLFAGWMMRRASGERRLRDTVAHLEARHETEQEGLRRDAAQLEEQLQALATELRSLTGENRRLRENADGEGRSIDSARAESIELNRRQIEAQERLQRIIHERDREIATLRAGLTGRSAAGPLAEVTSIVRDARPFGVDGLDETVRIDPALLPTALAMRASGGAVDERSRSRDEDERDDMTLESTMDVGFLDAEEATIALDEETLALVRGLGGGKAKG